MKKQSFIFLLLVIFFISCEKDPINGKNSLIQHEIEDPGENCSTGGIKVLSGIDDNSNGNLDESEIENIDYICNGNNGVDGGYDKVVLLTFPGAGYAYSSDTIDGHIYSSQIIKNFNIGNYTSIDSVSFNSYLYTYDSLVSCYLELYDVTNDRVIINTQISSNSLIEWEWVNSNINFLENIPEETIDLGVRIRPEVDGVLVSCYLPQIILYRK